MSREDKAAATRAALLRAARELFAERGYAGVGTEEIVRRARLTRGALYHHFEDKQDLFRAVFDETEREMTQSIASRTEGIADPWELIVTGTRAYLDACTDPALMRIALLDAPAVLGWREWREIDAKYGLGLVAGALEHGMESGVLRRAEVRPLAHLLLGALTEAAMMISGAEDPGAVRREVEGPVLALLEGLRA
ncbi:MAG TPA: TetR/AcrR family transcriptional regulator [Thermoleophilaceae bacterium]|jgi:AcrR family transcriptional regulator